MTVIALVMTFLSKLLAGNCQRIEAIKYSLYPELKFNQLNEPSGTTISPGSVAKKPRNSEKNLIKD